jgi:hypothetical protein
MERAIRQNRRQRFGEIIREQKADVSDLRTNGFAWKGGNMAGRDPRRALAKQAR